MNMKINQTYLTNNQMQCKLVLVSKMNAKRFLLIAILLSLTGPVPTADAQWQKVESPAEIDLHRVSADPCREGGLYAASQRRLYERGGEGARWKRLLTVKGTDNRITHVLADPRVDGRVYVASLDGLSWRRARGADWQAVPLAGASGSREVTAVAPAEPDGEAVYIGTKSGLYRWDPRGDAPDRVEEIGRAAVRGALTSAQGACVLTDEGVYRSKFESGQWSKVYSEVTAEEEPTSLEQYDIEEFAAATSGPDAIAYLGARDSWWAANRSKIVAGGTGDDAWSRIPEAGPGAGDVKAIAASSSTYYVATGQGMRRWSEESLSFEPVNDGLDTLDVRWVSYEARQDVLHAATPAGLYRWVHPEAEAVLLPGPAAQAGRDAMAAAKEVLARFRHEPTVLEIQQAAVRYAEVHPDKIKRWREAAARKACLPTLSLSGGIDSDENVDIDRGGTNDPDTFIIGPNERSFDWSVGLSWNLGEWIWNDDQTSIDVRSRLMVELREEILSEVTHLYFERRKLQAELALAPARDLPILVEKELRLQELTASIDALTDGYLSERLAAAGLETDGGVRLEPKT